jgi:methanogenic corrinoid protein MtbC1
VPGEPTPRVGDEPPRLPPVAREAASLTDASVMTADLLAALLADGDDELAAWVLRNALAGQRRADVYDGILRDAMTLVGRHWEDGRWSVAEEHLASQTLFRALDRVRSQPGPEGRIGPLAVLAGVAGEYHALGLACLAHVLTDDGWTVANLGADVPAADLVRFLQRNHASLVALTARLPERELAVREAVAAARAVCPDDPRPRPRRLA